MVFPRLQVAAEVRNLDVGVDGALLERSAHIDTPIPLRVKGFPLVREDRIDPLLIPGTRRHGRMFSNTRARDR